MNTAVLIVLDGMTASMITPEGTPSLYKFSQTYWHSEQFFSVFPSETRVAVSSIVTGCWPERHGLPANYFFLADDNRKFNSGNVDDLKQAEQVWSRILAEPDLGSLLARNNKALTTISGGSTGNCSLLNWNARAHGHRRYSLWSPKGCDSPERYAQMQADLGEVPTARSADELFAEETLAYFECLAFSELLRPDASDVVVIWFPEPDDVSHHSGLFTPEHAAHLAMADAFCGRVIDWWEQEGAKNGRHLLISSDHGHVSVGGGVPLRDHFCASGFAVCSENAPAGGDVCIRLHEAASAQVFLPSPDPAVAERMATWLMQQPWCGSLLLHPRLGLATPGALSAAEAFSAHAHSADIQFTLRDASQDMLLTAAGAPARCASRQGHTYRSTHGGLLPDELGIFMLAGGPAFRREHTSRLPAGIVDIAPTLLRLLGLSVPSTMQGRIMDELFTGSADDAATRPVAYKTLTSATGGYTQTLTQATLGDKRYIVGGARVAGGTV